LPINFTDSQLLTEKNLAGLFGIDYLSFILFEAYSLKWCSSDIQLDHWMLEEIKHRLLGDYSERESFPVTSLTLVIELVKAVEDYRSRLRKFQMRGSQRKRQGS
jgi:hypothetical protein